MYRIPLRVNGIDLADASVAACIESVDSLSDLGWEYTDGRVLAVLYYDGNNPVGAAIQVARRILHTIPNVSIEGIDYDLVSTSDIAVRAGVSREAVRLWVKGQRGPGGFPDPFDSVGGGEKGSLAVWCWPAVNLWLREHIGIVDEDEYLTLKQAAEVTTALLMVEELVDLEWKELVELDFPLSMVELDSGDAGIGLGKASSGEDDDDDDDDPFLPAVEAQVQTVPFPALGDIDG
jgi:hypothetical protein